MSVRAKFACNKIEITAHQKTVVGEYGKAVQPYQYEKVEMRTIHLNPVFSNNDPKHENSKFWDSSPSGGMTLGTINPDAWKHFTIGEEYYIDFTHAPKSVNK